MILSDFQMLEKDKYVKRELNLLNIDIFYFYCFLYFIYIDSI